jgi:hypothetical protein
VSRVFQKIEAIEVLSGARNFLGRHIGDAMAPVARRIISRRTAQ